MVYESDFYTSRRPYSSRPLVSSYTVTTPSRSYYTVADEPTGRNAQQQYSYSYSSTTERSRDSNNPYSRPERSSYSSTTERRSEAGPGGYNYSTDRTSTTGSRPDTTPCDKRTDCVSVTGTRITTSPSRIISTRVIRSSPARYIRASVTPPRYIRASVTPPRFIRASVTPTRVITSPLRVNYYRTHPSVLAREFRRIESKALTHPHYYATESYLNSEECRSFDDETRDIRNRSNALLRKVHTRVERAQSVSPASYASKYESKYGPDSFVSRLWTPLKSTVYDGLESYNPNKYIGKSHLASVRIVGNKGYNKRRATTHFDDDKVRNDVNLLSYYLKNRKAAAEKKETPVVLESAKLDPFRPSRKFSQPKSLEDEADLELKDKQAARAERLNVLSEETLDEIALEKKKAQRETARQLEEKALKEEAENKAEEARREEIIRQEKLAAQAAAEREEKLRLAQEAEERRLADEAEERRLAQIAEEKRLAKEKRLAEEAEEKRQAEEAEERRLAEEQEEKRLAEEKRQAEERAAEEQRLVEEQKVRENELARLAELEKIAQEEEEREIARQAAELAELARQQEAAAQREAEELEAQSAASETERTASEAAEHEEASETADEEEATLHESAAEAVVEEPESVAEPSTNAETGGDVTEEEVEEEEEEEEE